MAGICGCTVYSPVEIVATTQPLPDLGKARVVGKAEAESCQAFIFGIPLSPNPPLAEAYRAATSKLTADALINVTADRTDLAILIYRNDCVTIRGDGVVYQR